MGLLDQVIGGLMGGGASGGSSPMASVLMGLLGGQQGGGGMGGMGGGGGIQNLVSQFEQAGLGHIAQSWVGNGPESSRLARPAAIGVRRAAGQRHGGPGRHAQAGFPLATQPAFAFCGGWHDAGRQRGHGVGLMRRVALLAAAGLLAAQAPARADNAMGYRLVAPQEAATLPKRGGALGLDLQRAEIINEPGMSFELMRVSRVRSGSPGERAGLRAGDELISVNGRVFPSLAVFAAYVGSLPPGEPAVVDYIPAGGGPAQAQRVKLVPGAAPPAQHGMSTREKVAIGVGAAALFGCYEMGCFAHRQPPQPAPMRQ